MLELEFLPSWYPRLRRARRRLVIQAWCVLILIAGLGLWVFLAQRNIEQKRMQHEVVTRQLADTRAALRHLDEQTSLRQQLHQQHQVLRKLGLHVEAARIISSLDRVMPREMTLLSLNIDTKELNRPVQVPGGAKAAVGVQPLVERRLTVELTAVAPTNVDVANFLAELTNVPFFEDVSPKAIEPMIASGHEMRRFDVTFSMNLSEAGS